MLDWFFCRVIICSLEQLMSKSLASEWQLCTYIHANMKSLCNTGKKITLQAFIHMLNFNMNSLKSNQKNWLCGCLFAKPGLSTAVIEFFDHLELYICQCVRNFLSYWALSFCIDIVILKREQPSETGISSNLYARQWHTTPSKVSLPKLAFKLQLRNGFIPEHFLTAKIEIKWSKSYHKPAQTLIFIPFLSYCCHICSYDGLHLFHPKGWIPTCDLSKKKLGGKKTAFTRKNEEMDACRTWTFYLRYLMTQI